MITDYQTAVAALLRDDSGQITPTDIDAAIAVAVTRYSKDKPRAVVADVAADGHVLTQPAGWVDGFSDVVAIEYPIGNVPPTLIEGHEIYQAPDSEQIRVLSSLSTGEQVRVTHTVFHIVNDVTDTVPLDDREAVVAYGAAVLCDNLAGWYANNSDSTIQADSVDHRSQSTAWAARAKALRKQYQDAIGVNDQRNVAAGVVIDHDMPNSRGRDRLFHSGRYR